jgi:hypothetical protein
MRRGPLILLCLVAGCSGGASPDIGITAYLRASGAQFVEGPLPAATNNPEPAIRGVNLVNTTIYPGLENFPLSGSVEQGISTLVGLAGDSGYWIIQAPLPDPQTPGNYTFSTQLTFSPDLPRQAANLTMIGVDSSGQLGKPLILPLSVSTPTPKGQLVFTLTWDTEADLDLHVVMPNTADPTKPIEIWSRAPVGLPPLGPADPPYDVATVAAAPYLDMDSNAACVIDGRRQENVIFPNMPPNGTYIARVDAFSMCGQPDAQWRLDVTTPNGPLVNPATWEATDTDTRGAHGAGAGRLAVQFTLPL